MFRLRTHVLLAAFMVTLLGATSAFAQAGFAKIRGTSGVVVSSGGSQTTGVSAVRTSDGNYDITFTGRFLSGVTLDQVIINTTAQSFNFGVTNAFVVSANDSTIVVHVYVWKSDTLAYIDHDIFITINIGS